MINPTSPEQNKLITLFVLAFLTALSLSCLMIMTIVLVNHPEATLPTIVTTLLGGIVGFCFHWLGWSGGLQLPSSPTIAEKETVGVSKRDTYA